MERRRPKYKDRNITISVSSLPDKVQDFEFIVGDQRRAIRDQDSIDFQVAALVGRLYDALADFGHKDCDLERFLVRLIFCMFADSTGVFESRGVYLNFVESRTAEDGADLGEWLTHLFQTLNTPVDRRPATLHEDLARFPCIDGDLFEEHLQRLSFDTQMRSLLLDVCRLDWSRISPAIFSSLFQSVMDSIERRAQGAHYTTEQNILKLIKPLFFRRFVLGAETYQYSK